MRQIVAVDASPPDRRRSDATARNEPVSDYDIRAVGNVVIRSGGRGAALWMTGLRAFVLSLHGCDGGWRSGLPVAQVPKPALHGRPAEHPAHMTDAFVEVTVMLSQLECWKGCVSLRPNQSRDGPLVANVPPPDATSRLPSSHP
jgi:hypothetical protein